MKLISDSEKLRSLLGWDPRTAVISPQIHLDGPKMVGPLLLEDGSGARHLICPEREWGNLSAAGVATEETLFIHPYALLRLERPRPKVAANLVEALALTSGDHPRLTIGSDLPYGMYLRLRETFPIDAGHAAEHPPALLVAYRIPKKSVLGRFHDLRERAWRAASSCLASSGGVLPLVNEAAGLPDTRFAAADALLEQVRADTLCTAAPVNAAELVSLPLPAGSYALYGHGDDVVHLLLPGEHNAASVGERVGSFDSVAAAVASLGAGDRLAVDETFLDLGTALSLEHGGRQLIPSSRALAKWRERRDFEDLASTAVLAQITARAIDGALDWTAGCIASSREISEMDVFRRYLALAETEAARLGPGLRIRPYFTCCQAARRTVYPSQPADFPVDGRAGTVKIDAGLMLTCDDVTMATSDLARTLCLSPGAKETYQLFLSTVRQLVRNELSVGQQYADVHHRCVSHLVELTSDLRSYGTLDNSVDVPMIYSARNVGHAMGKQESFVTEFRQEDTALLEKGALGALEIQWPYDPYAIGAEEMWVMSDDCGLLLSTYDT